jgi:hypothetical protein
VVSTVTAVAAALVTLLALAAPAYAADTIKVEIRQLADKVLAGGNGTGMRVLLTNNAEGAANGVHTVITVRLAGTPADAIHLRKGGAELPRQDGDGMVTFTDPETFSLARRENRRLDYSLQFAANALAGKATIDVVAMAEGQPLGSTSRSLDVIGSSEGPPNTDPGFIPTAGPGETYSVPPLPGTEAARQLTASVPKSLYGLGFVLVALGLVTLFLIFRPPGRVPMRAASGADPVGSGPSWHRRGQDGAAAQQGWPTVARPATPRRPAPGEPGPAPGRPVRDSGAPSNPRPSRDFGPHTGTGRPIRDAGPGDSLPPWLRP